MEFENVEIKFNRRIGEKRVFQLKINGQEIKSVSNVSIDISAEGIPVMKIELLLDSLNYKQNIDEIEDKKKH